MNRRSSQLEMRLVEWGREYGGGKYDDVGWQGVSPIVTLMTYHGQAPQGLGVKVPTRDRTPADEVQAAIDALSAQAQGWIPAQVIRAEYLLPGQPVLAKLQKLRRIGASVCDRSRYSQHLHTARVHVAGWIRVPFSDERDADDDCRPKCIAEVRG